jgi:hypothetical protein
MIFLHSWVFAQLLTHQMDDEIFELNGQRIYRELLLIDRISKEGLVNWQIIAERIGTHTKEGVIELYNGVYVDSCGLPLPVCPFDSSRSIH